MLSVLLGGQVLAWVRTVYTRLSGTNDRAPFRPERTGNFPVAEPQRICFAALFIRGYRACHRPIFICMEGTSSQEVSTRSRYAPTVKACHRPMHEDQDGQRQKMPAHATTARPHPLLHKIGIENGKRQCRDCRHDGDVDPELDDVEASRRTKQCRSQHNHEYQRLDGCFQSNRRWMIHIADAESDFAAR
jgi:hypothetical protein